MDINQLKELIKQVVKEESDYQQLFKHMLDKTGKSIPDMSDAEKVKFFQAVDKAAKAKSEGRLTGLPEELTDKQKQIDVDKDGEIEGSDLAALRNKKKEVDEMEFATQAAADAYKKAHKVKPGTKITVKSSQGYGSKPGPNYKNKLQSKKDWDDLRKIYKGDVKDEKGKVIKHKNDPLNKKK